MKQGFDQQVSVMEQTHTFIILILEKQTGEMINYLSWEW